MKEKDTFKLNPANILAEGLQEYLLRVYINFNPAERRFLHQIQNYFEGLKVTDVSNQDLKNFPKYAAASMRLNPNKFKAFHGATMGSFYNSLGMRIIGKMRSSTKSVELKKKKQKKNKMKKLRKLRRNQKLKNKKLKLKKIQR